MDIPAAIQRASASHQRGDLAAAERAYEDILAQDPNQADVLFLSGTLFAQRGQWEAAQSRLQHLVSLHPQHSKAWLNLARVLEQTGSVSDSLPCFEKHLHLNPDAAPAWFNYGQSAFRCKQWDQAERAYRRYVELVPDSVEGHFNLAAALQDANKLDAAKREYERVLQLAPRQAEAHRGLGNIALLERRYAQAVSHFRAALAIFPEDVESLSNLGVMLQKTGHLAEAESASREVLRIAPDHINAHFNLGLVLLLQGKFHEGWQEYAWRRHIKHSVPMRFAQPEWDGAPLDSKTILLRGEQGFGDTFQFVRYAPLVQAKGGRVAVECQSKLKRILLRTPGIDVITERTADRQPLIDFDVHAPLLELPSLFDSDFETLPKQVPYIFPEPWLVERWRARLAQDRGLRVGIVWAGRPTHEDDQNRSCPLRNFLSFAVIPGITLYSLQKGQATQELSLPENAGRVVDLDVEIDDFADTAAVIANLDLVISVDTSVVHLAGAMNVPAWVVLPFAPDWRWLASGEDTPWYPSVRLFRQQAHGDWDTVFSELNAALSVLATHPPERAAAVLPAMSYDPQTIEELRQARIALHQQNWQAAAEISQTVQSRLPMQAEANYLLGDAWFNLGRIEEALDALATAYESWPQHPLLLKLLGNVLQILGQFPEAEQCYRAALQYGNDDPEVLFNLGVLKHQEGQIEAALDLYRHALALQPAFPDCLNNLGLALGALGHLDEAIQTYRRALSLRPDFFDSILNLANALYVQGQVQSALEHFQRAVQLQPRHARARLGLGVALKRESRLEEAIAELQLAVQLAPDMTEAQNNLGNALKAAGKLLEAIAAYHGALAINPKNALAWSNLGSALQQQGLMEEAIQALDCAIDLDPALPEAHWNRALALLAEGDFQQGWQEYEWGFAAGARPITPRSFPQWDGSPCPGKGLLVSTEQGFGDAIQFVRFIQAVRPRVGRILLECPSELARLFARVAGVDAIVDRATPDAALPEVVARIPLMSLPGLLGIQRESMAGDLAYLFSDREQVTAMQALLGADRYKIGLVWAGSPSHQDDQARSCSLKWLKPLFEIQSVGWYSLQPGGAGAIREAGVPVRDLTSGFKDFADTAAAIDCLDLIITVDTAVAHLAGAMGKPVWMLLPASADWRWGRAGETTPWYTSARLFRQVRRGDWSVPVQAIAAALRKQLGPA